MKSDINYFVNRAHAGLEDDKYDLENLGFTDWNQPGVSTHTLGRGCKRNQNGRIRWTWCLCGSSDLKTRCWNNSMILDS